MKRESEWLAAAVELYKEGMSFENIEKQVGVPRKRIGLRINALVEEGIIEKRGQIKRAQRQTARKKALIEEIKIRIITNKPLADLAPKYGISEKTLTRILRELEHKGEVEKKPRVRKPYKPREVKPKEFQKKERKVTEIVSTLRPGETIRCTPEVSRTCVYGNQYATNSNTKCRYSLITGKNRSIGPDGCKTCACTKYSKISKDNPRQECPGD